MVLGAGLGVAGLAIHNNLQWAGAQGPAAAPVGSSSVVVINTATGQGDPQLVLVDTENRVMGAYQVSAQSGEITLKSVRNFRWDLMMDEFNGKEPSPREIRALLENH
jgi:hypothetical protein